MFVNCTRRCSVRVVYSNISRVSINACPDHFRDRRRATALRVMHDTVNFMARLRIRIQLVYVTHFAFMGVRSWYCLRPIFTEAQAKSGEKRRVS
uniref:Uncharacterized protein n=1 Tax=Pararge aegeria TaxID=116150 RepID=S4PAI2_9NEOP